MFLLTARLEKHHRRPSILIVKNPALLRPGLLGTGEERSKEERVFLRGSGVSNAPEAAMRADRRSGGDVSSVRLWEHFPRVPGEEGGG